jgi:hypothetical protein
MPMILVAEFPYFLCTKDDPWEKAKAPGVRVEHADAKYVGDRDYGGGEYCERYECPHCLKSFEVELPQ